MTLPDGVKVSYAYIVDPSAPSGTAEYLSSEELFGGFASPKPEDAEYAVSAETHHWTKPTFAWLAEEKQHLLNRALEEGFDAIFLVDSDLVLGSETLTSLITANQPIVSAVFWTRWTPEAPPLPQVWMTHPYEFQGKGKEAHEFLDDIRSRRLTQVGGLGACTLIRAEALAKGVGFWPLLDGLPEDGMWQGEDRHFCVRAARLHIPLVADPWPEIFHIYRPEDVRRIPSLNPPKEEAAKVGDLVSFILEPCEEPALAGQRTHVRGRLGAMKLLPGIEEALKVTPPGEDRFLSLRFPLWWKIPQYRGQKKIVLLRVLGVKEWDLPPTLKEFEGEDPFEAFM